MPEPIINSVIRLFIQTIFREIRYRMCKGGLRATRNDLLDILDDYETELLGNSNNEKKG
jgi:hypothetical protein